MKNRVQLVLLIAVLLLVHPASGHLPGPLDSFGSSVSEADGVELRTIMFPVAGPADYSDTFGACRDGCTRLHEGVDIFAPKLTPLIAAADGRIVSERRNATKKAGNKLVIEDADGWRYVYVHLNNDTPGTDDNANPQSWIAAGDLRAGDMVRSGQVIGYLGDSGNAEETPPHLHFEIIPPGRSSVNPTPSVTAARGRGDVVAAGELWLGPDLRSAWEPTVEAVYEDLAGRAPTDDELDSWTNRLALGLGSEVDLIADLAMAAPYREPEGMALRAHVVTFGRVPSEATLDEFAAAYRDGDTTAELAARLVAPGDRRALPPSAPGADLDAEEIAARAESNDVKLATWHLLQIVRAYRGAAGRLPTEEEIDAWAGYLEADGLMVDVVAGVLDDALPIGEPRNAGVYSPADLGYTPGVNVRQGPVDLDPSSDAGDGGIGTLTFGEPQFDMELTVDEDDDGTDVANLTVRIPVDELEANGDGDAELTIELQLTPGTGADGEPVAAADIELVPADPSDRSTDRGRASGAANDDPGPAVSPPTTRRPSAQPPSVAPPAPATTTTTTTTPPAAAPAPATAPTTTAATTTTTTAAADQATDPTATAVAPTSETTTAGDERSDTTCVPATDSVPEPTQPLESSPGTSSTALTTTTTTCAAPAAPGSDDEGSSAEPPPTDTTTADADPPADTCEQAAATDDTAPTASDSPCPTDDTDAPDDSSPPAATCEQETADSAPMSSDTPCPTDDTTPPADTCEPTAATPTDDQTPCTEAGTDADAAPGPAADTCEPTPDDTAATPTDDQTPCTEAGTDADAAPEPTTDATSSAQEPSAALRMPAVERPSAARRRRVLVLARP